MVTPLLSTLLQVNNLENAHARTREESAVLYLDLPYGTNPDLAFIEVNEKIDQAMESLPREVERPRVLAADVSDIPVVHLSITSDPTRAGPTELLELSNLARNVLRRRLEQLDEVAFADLSGQREARISIHPNENVLRSLGLSDADLFRLISAANVELGGLLLADGPYQYNVRFTGGLRTVDDLRNLYLNLDGQTEADESGATTRPSAPPRLVSLKDLAEVNYTTAPTRGAYFYNDRPGVVFALRKRADARLLALNNKLGELVDDLRLTYPSLRFDLHNDQTVVLRASIENLTTGLLYGAGFAILILFAFFREWRRPLLIGLAVPVALLVAVVGFYLAGLSINVISLAGLILGVGLMIDNSIIVLDNFSGGDIDGAANGTPTRLNTTTSVAQATGEVIRPLISSALTTVAVFLPLVLLSGIAGALFQDQALAVTLALAASLLVAFIPLPVLYLQTVKSRKPPPGGQGAQGAPPPPNNRKRFNLSRWWLLALLPWMLLGYLALRSLPTQSFPTLSRTDYQLTIDFNETLSTDELSRRSLTLAQEWRERYGGATSLQVGEDRFLLAEEQQTGSAATLEGYLPEAPPPDFAADWLAQLQNRFPRATINFTPVANLFDRIFLTDEPYLEAKLRYVNGRTAPDPTAVAPVLQALNSSNLAPAQPAETSSVALRIDYAQAERNRVDPAVLRARLLTLFGENEITRLRTGDRALPVVLTTTDSLTELGLRNATVLNRDGNPIALRYLISTERLTEYRTLTADGAGPYLSLRFPDNADPTAVAQTLRQFPEFTTQLSGRYLSDQSRLAEVGGVLLVSLLLLYLILAAQFEGLLLPFVVLLVVPISLVGAVLALWISGESLNLISLIGMVVAGGIIVNDAIIKVDMIERGRAAGLALAEALYQANRRRLRAIVMTSLTTILALGPVLLTDGLGAELQRPLAITVIGGLLVGTATSLYVLPQLYRLLVRARPRVQGEETSPQAKDPAP